MAEGQKKRQVGKGMKPRGNKRFKPQKETRAMVEKVTNEGQAQGTPEPVLEPEVRNETPGNLEPENGPELLQNLEQKEAIVAHDEGLDLSDVRVFSDPSELEAALKESESGPISDEEALKRGIVVERDSAGIISSAHPVSVDMETAMAVGARTVIELKRPTIDELEELLNRHGSEGVSLEPNGAVKSAIGPQPDGSEKFIITIQEGYTDAVRQWAEADGIPVEQWLSDRLYEYVSTYGEPAKGR